MDYPKSVPSVGLSNGKFVNEDQVSGTPGSLIPAEWANAITEEMLGAIRSAGLEPTENQNNQLGLALQALVDKAMPTQATEVAAGIAMVATDDDLSKGTNDAKFLTAKKIKTWFATVMKQATETAFGWVKLATQAQTDDLADDATAVTPKKLGVTMKAAIKANRLPLLQAITASVANNALTLGLPANSIDFRSPTLGSGVVNSRVFNTPLALVVPAGATLGSTSGVASRLALLAIDNAGTVELAVINWICGFNLDETGVITTVAMSATANLATVAYSTTARSAVPYRVLGLIDSVQATAGTWATAPSTVQGAGGQAIVGMTSIGYGQTLQDVSGSRVAGTAYTNTTGKPITVLLSGGALNTSRVFTLTSPAGTSLSTTWNNSGANTLVTTAFSMVVPPGYSYSNTGAVNTWQELR